jgi:hypothetical protein
LLVCRKTAAEERKLKRLILKNSQYELHPTAYLSLLFIPE